VTGKRAIYFSEAMYQLSACVYLHFQCRHSSIWSVAQWGI